MAPETEMVSPSIAHIKNLSVLQTRGANLIKMRINTLNVLKTRIQKSKLTDTQKSSLVATIDGRVVSLNALAEQIKAAKTADEARKLVDSVYSGYRIYAIVKPQIERTMKLNEMTNYLNKLTTETFTKVQSKIDATKAKGKDVTVWQKNLDGAKAAVPGIQSKIDAAMKKVSALQPSDYPTSSKTIFADLKTALTGIHQDMLSLHKNLWKMK